MKNKIEAILARNVDEKLLESLFGCEKIIVKKAVLDGTNESRS